MTAILLCGHGRHGKDAVAELLKEYGFRSYSPTKWFANEVMLPASRAAWQDRKPDDPQPPLPYYSSAEACWEDRVNHRQVWIDAIAAFNGEDGTLLAEMMVAQGSDIYIGIRRLAEFYAVKRAGIFQATVWVDAAERLPLEPTCELSGYMCDYYVNNNGPLEDLPAEVEKLVNAIEKDHPRD